MLYYALSLSSNITPKESIARAFACLENVGLLQTAGLYPFAAIDGVSPDYLNSAAIIACGLSHAELYDYSKSVEQQIGRSKGTKGHIKIDIDIEAQAPSLAALAAAIHGLDSPIYIHTPLLELANSIDSKRVLL